jgi:hypothetical protein
MSKKSESESESESESGKKNVRKCGKCGRVGHYAKTCKYKTRFVLSAPKVKSAPITTGTTGGQISADLTHQVVELMDKWEARRMSMYDRMMEKFRMESGLILSEMRKIKSHSNPMVMKPCPRCNGKGKISTYDEYMR